MITYIASINRICNQQSNPNQIIYISPSADRADFCTTFIKNIIFRLVVHLAINWNEHCSFLSFLWTMAEFVEYREGTGLPLIICVPHDGQEKPNEINDRKKGGSKIYSLFLKSKILSFFSCWLNDSRYWRRPVCWINRKVWQVSTPCYIQAAQVSIQHYKIAE